MPCYYIISAGPGHVKKNRIYVWLKIQDRANVNSCISGKRKLKDASFGTINADGSINVNWSLLYANNHVDDYGFDMRHREARGKYKIRVLLPKGCRLIRYGSEDGHFTAPDGEDYESLSLPYVRETVEFHRYSVIADNVEVFCFVDKGITAPGFGSPGGGIQFYHSKSIVQCIRALEIERNPL